MNRLLVLVVILLVPIAIFTKNNDAQVYSPNNQNIALELPIKYQEEIFNDEAKKEVLVSSNRDKSNPYYVELEEYIVGVVAGEMPASFSLEALKAQAVAARTYALYKMQNVPGYVLSTTVNDQVYLSIDAMKNKWGNDFNYYYNRVKDAVKSTEGEVITYNGDVIIAYYFAISNGATDDAKTVFNEDKAYLVSVDSSWDKNYRVYKAGFNMSKSNFLSKLGLNGDQIIIQNMCRSNNNYVREVTINNQKFSGLDIFNKLNLRSTDFNLTVNGDNVYIETYGFGHSVGMSQYGAQGMAEAGKTYQEILKHYYKNTDITKLEV